MKTFNEFLAENAIRPGGQVRDRSLEGFKTILDQLQAEVKAVLDPEAKAALQSVVSEFYQKMRTILVACNKQGVGYSQQYRPN